MHVMPPVLSATRVSPAFARCPIRFAPAQVQHEVYDAVVVCNGHYAEPRLPDPSQVRGLLPPGLFPGQQLHSHNYREPTQWAGKVRQGWVGRGLSRAACAA